MKLGSLFDGSGGFMLAGAMCGIEPVWSSEIEPYPLKVTAARFPEVRQLGDVTRIDGAAIEPVDVVTFGSPCQDLSVAGKQAGIHAGARSSLFFEAVRIIKEMRNATADEFPRYAVWENVPGAFSSNGGEDFRAVIEALGGVREDGLSIPRPEKWRNAGSVVGRGWSIAWRVYDAQYWGVPQRRKRIYLIADFRSERACEILFERDSVRGHTEPGGKARESIAEDAERGARRGGSAGLTYCLQGNGIDRADSAGCNGRGWREDVSYTLNTIDRPAVVYYAEQSIGEYAESDVASAMLARQYKSATDIVLYEPKSLMDENWAEAKVKHALRADASKSASVVVEQSVYDMTHANDVIREYAGVSPTLNARMGTGGNQVPIRVEAGTPPRKYIVRRLTPLECCRLQGFPDDWEAGVDGSDSARYKMWGNGIALPCAVDVMRRIAKHANLNGDV